MLYEVITDLNINNGLELLIQEVEKIEGIETARILYLYPSTTTLELIEKIKDSKVFENYFDMPLQHITPHMLKTMKRGKGVVITSYSIHYTKLYELYLQILSFFKPWFEC